MKEEYIFSDNHMSFSVYILYIRATGLIVGLKGPMGAQGHQRQ